jgi:hypothetical protein
LHNMCGTLDIDCITRTIFQYYLDLMQANVAYYIVTFCTN